MQLAGKCHCGTITYVLNWPSDGADIPVRACSCSFCTKHGAAWTAHRDAELAAVVRKSGVSKYSFGTQTAEFYLCSRCGVVPFVISTIDDRTYGVVNVNTLDRVAPSSFSRSAANFDGEDTTSRLERRKRNWIPSVRVSTSDV